MISPVVILLAMFAGASLLVSAGFARMSFGVGAHRYHPWMAVFALGAAITCVLRIVQMTASDPGVAMFMATAFGSGAALLSVMWIRVVRTMHDRQVVTPGYVVFSIVQVGVALAIWVPGGFFLHEPLERLDPAGYGFVGLTPGPLAPALVVSAAAMIGMLLYATWEFPRERGVERRILLLSSVVASLLVATTYVQAALAPWVPSLGVLAYPILVIPAAAVLAQQIDDLTRDLDIRVRERTEALHDRNDRLQEAVRVAEASRESQARFLANISHELRTPLTGVLGILDLLRAGDEDAPRLLGVARASGGELLELINELLDAARIDANMVDLESRPVSIRLLMDALLEVHRPAAASKGLILEAAVDEAVPVAISVDPTRLKQILHNLVGNALKFTDTGSVRLSVGREVDSLVFEVVDTGPGISSERDLFDRFTLADDSTTRVYGGTGLGLSIARDFARLMGGDLRARDREGRGATFTLTLPLVVAESHAVAVTEPRPPERLTFRGEVLLVDDDPTNRLVVGRLLERFGLEVVLATDGEEALERVSERPPHLIFMDCYMPGMDGFTATQTLRSSGCTLPIVALTASAGAADRTASLEAGMDDHLSKPVMLPELEQVLERFLT